MSYINDITVATKSFLRDQKTRECYFSFQEQYPGIKFIIIDDGNPSPEQEEFYKNIEASGHKVMKTEFDIGISKGRNMCLRLANTKYVLIVDNDEHAIPETNLEHMWKILEKNPEISIVGGSLYEPQSKKQYPRFDGFLNIESTKEGTRILRYTYLDHDKCQWRDADGVKFADVDIVFNFLLVRRDIYPDLVWEEELKVCGEHTDFFLTAKEKGYKTAFCPSSVIHHNYDKERTPEYEKYRMRLGYQNILAKKWNLDFSIDFWGRNHAYEKAQ